jgi:hypothetical protein
MSPRLDLTPSLTDWLTVSRNVTLTYTANCSSYITSAPILHKTPLSTIPPLFSASPLPSNTCLFSSYLAILGYVAVASQRISYSLHNYLCKIVKIMVTTSNNSTTLFYFTHMHQFSEIMYIISINLHRYRYIGTWLLKAGIVKPENTVIARQRRVETRFYGNNEY